MSKIFLGIDQSITATAWCKLNAEGELLEFDVIKTMVKRDCRFDLHRRVSIISDRVLEAAAGCDFLTREGLAFGGKGNASRDLAYLVGGIERECGAFYEIAPPSLKKFATGSGRAEKDEMVAALPNDVKQQFLDAGYLKTTGLRDLADAYFIGLYFVNKYNEGGEL